MSVNFLDTSGLCQGADFHMYFTIGPFGVPLPVPLVPHAVFDGHDQQSRFWRIATTVTTEGKPTLQSSWAMIIVPHIFVPAGPPHPAAETINICAIMATGSITPQLSVHGVTGGGQQLLAELDGAHGANVDCSDMPAPGLSADFNVNSVMTTPTLGDYLAALWNAILTIGEAWLISAVVGDKVTAAGKLEQIIVQSLANLGIAIVQTLLDQVNSNLTGIAALIVNDPIVTLINLIATWVQSQADRAAPAQRRAQ